MAKSEFIESSDIEGMMERLPVEMRVKTLPRAVGKGAMVVKRQAKKIVSVGNPSHHPDKKALKDSIIVKTKQYKNDQIHLAMAGPSFPEGAHGHLVEKGHEVVVSRGDRKGQSPLSGSARVPGKEFLAPAIDSTMEQQEAAVMNEIKKDIIKFGG